MKNNYLNRQATTFLKFTKALLILVVIIFGANNLSAQCTDVDMTTANGASVSDSGTQGLCLFCSVSNEDNVTDADLSNFATISIPVGVGGSGFVRVQLPQTYPAGTRVGFIADVNGGIAGLFNGVTLRAYNNGSLVGSIGSGSLINILGLGGGTNVSGVFCSDFDEIEISAGSLAGVLASYRIYSAFVTEDCEFPVQCGADSSPEFCYDQIDNDGDGLVDDEDTCDITCSSGLNSPQLSSNTIENDCPDTTVDLTTITATNQPANTQLTWHTSSPATGANLVANPSASSASGSYYAAFYDDTNNCYSGINGDATTEVTASSVECCPAGDVAPNFGN